ncbi:MAG: hypothetical protein N0E37_00770 [Candidatus Thiodiazotropha taylori]|nr:hypothetical protein [Candidatus Thiodiazotropha taylori]MCG7916266.1 hypothetical protein [Candidatus Thiodiazotropha taylori]MCW4242950.1 hypothetical protein [Candidatus Thiodiazotropha taylori]
MRQPALDSLPSLTSLESLAVSSLFSKLLITCYYPCCYTKKLILFLVKININ